MTIIIRLAHTMLFALPLAAAPIYAASLPDTGQDTCYNNTAPDSVAASDPASIARDAGTHPRQDCRYGRDAAAAAGVLTKIGAGAKGFDYTKIANNGDTLAAAAALGTAATDWACTKDNITGLTWEVKTATNTDLRYYGHYYRWYSTDGSTNGGIIGDIGLFAACNGTLPGGLCSTAAFIAAVNTAALCSYTDWRMPTVRELGTLVYDNKLRGESDPAIDLTYFPNSDSWGYWSGTTYVPNPNLVWVVSYGSPATFVTATASKLANAGLVRLVHGGPF